MAVYDCVMRDILYRLVKLIKVCKTSNLLRLADERLTYFYGTYIIHILNIQKYEQ